MDCNMYFNMDFNMNFNMNFNNIFTIEIDDLLDMYLYFSN